MLRLVNKIPVNTKNVLIHLRYFFINIITLPIFYKNLIIYDVFTYFCTFCTSQKILNYICYISFQSCLGNCLDI